MKTKVYLFLFFCITLFSLGFFILILFNVDPYSADILSQSAFFVSLFAFIFGILTLVSFYVRVKISNNEVFFANFAPSVRQSVLVALVFVGLLVLKTLQVLTWWDGAMFALAILLLELYFQNKQITSNKLQEQ